MKIHGNILTLLTTLATLQLLPMQALAQGAASPGPSQESREQGQDRPPTPEPKDPPPPPPSERPAPPSEAPRRPERERLPHTGQWVYTRQYGWVWMPYGDAYTHVPPDGNPPSMYVYGPDLGWCWVEAPWLWGWGPRPYFGIGGPYAFAWFGVGLGHWYGFSRPYRYWGWPERSYWHGGRWNHVEPFGRGAGRGWAPHGGGGHSRSLAPGWRR